MKANGLRTLGELESYFFDNIRKEVVAHGKSVVGFEEVARAAIPDDVVVMTWRSSSAIARVTAQGNPVIVVGGFYLDKLWPAEDHHEIDPQDPNAYGLTQEDFEEGKAKGLPEAILGQGPDDRSVAEAFPGTRGAGAGWRSSPMDRASHGRNARQSGVGRVPRLPPSASGRRPPSATRQICIDD
jgi:Glycosyl hydrolase family 20, catalytic domain